MNRKRRKSLSLLLVFALFVTTIVSNLAWADTVETQAPTAEETNITLEETTESYVEDTSEEVIEQSEAGNIEADSKEVQDNECSSGSETNEEAKISVNPSEVSEVLSTEEEISGSEYIYEDSEIQLRATTAQPGILPEDAVVKAEKVTQEDRIENAYALLFQKALEKNTGLIDFTLYDISFYQGTREIEPAGEVDVSIQFLQTEKLSSAAEDTTSVEVYHIEENNTLEEVAATTQVAEDDSLQSVDLTSDAFSEYPIGVFGEKIYGGSFEENAIQAAVQTQAANLFTTGTDGDSGLTLGKTARINNNNTATVTLEAYATGTVTTVENKLPTDIVLVLDQSGSMAETIESYVYTAVYNVSMSSTGSLDETYYIKLDNEDVRVKHGEHRSTVNNSKHYCWYYSKNGNNIDVYPYTNSLGNAVGTPAYQFYERTASSTSKLQALKSAVSGFVTNVTEDAQNRQVNNRIAMVGFGVGNYIDNTYVAGLNTELFVGETAYSYNNATIYNKTDGSLYSGNQYTGIASQYQNAFQDVTTTAGAANLQASINALTAMGATRADLGMDMANRVLNAYANDYTTGQRNKVVIMFTDGEPNNDSGFSSNVANATISQAYVTKNTYKATVYGAGVVSSLNPELNPASTTTSNMNRYMQYLSSNFPRATSLTAPGADGNYLAGYFLSATNAAELQEIFQNISSSIGSSGTTLGASAVLKDYISPYFDIGQLAESSVDVYTSRYLGSQTWAEKAAFANADISCDKTAGTVSVTNFDYSDNYCLDHDPQTGNPRGQKIIVEITIPTIPGFIGGNEVPTNTSDAAIYDGDQVVDRFPEPDVDVDLQYTFDSQDQSIYIRDRWETVEHFFDDAATAGIQYRQGASTYTIDGIVNNFVNISYTVRDEDGTVVGVYEIPAGETAGTWTTPVTIGTETLNGDADYTIAVNVTPVSDRTVAAITDAQNATIHVFKPEVAVADRTLFYGDTLNLNNQAADQINWHCDCTSETVELPAGDSPDLTYKYSKVRGTDIENPLKYQPTEQSDIKLTVKRGEYDITTCTTITNADGRDQYHDFTIHVVKGELQLTKTIDEPYSKIEKINAHETFLFKIQRYAVTEDGSKGELAETFYETLAFDANQKVFTATSKITGLKKGYYTVTEETTWTPKYNLVSVEDNQDGNAPEGEELFIGRQLENKSGSEKPNFYGLEQSTSYTSLADGDPATVNLFNEIRNDWQWLSDAASAWNRFVR